MTQERCYCNDGAHSHQCEKKTGQNRDGRKARKAQDKREVVRGINGTQYVHLIGPLGEVLEDVVGELDNLSPQKAAHEKESKNNGDQFNGEG